jgi:hypothetical protein
MLVAIAILATLATAWYGGTYWRIAADGATARALSVKPEAKPKLGKNTLGDPYRYFASYRFIDASGREHSSRQTISRDLYEALSRGDISLRIYYSRAHPEVNVIDLDAVRWLSLILGGIAALCWLAALLRFVRG